MGVSNAGFRIITAKAIAPGWEKSYFFDFSAVVTDQIGS